MTDSGPAQKPAQRRPSGARTSTRAGQAVAPTPDDGEPETDAQTGPARHALAKGASSAREYRVPLAVAAGALVMGLLIIRMRSKR